MLHHRSVVLALVGLLAACATGAKLTAATDQAATDVAAAGMPVAEAKEESLGSQLLTAVMADDLAGASAVFASAAPDQTARLANAIDWRGKSVLMHAASRNYATLVALLLQNEARPDAADYSAGATALMLAARNGSLAAAAALVAGGASPNAITPSGTSVLMHAVANGSAPLVAFLLKKGAGPNHLDKSGACALSIAAGLAHHEALEILIKNGAKVLVDFLYMVNGRKGKRVFHLHLMCFSLSTRTPRKGGLVRG